jgi:hypothetical protein
MELVGCSEDLEPNLSEISTTITTVINVAKVAPIEALLSPGLYLGR